MSFRIVKKERLTDKIFAMEIEAPRVAKAANPGQFIIIKIDEKGERVPLTIADYDKEKGTVKIVLQTVGASTIKLAEIEENDFVNDFVGPLGNPSEFIYEDIEDLKKENIIFVAGGVGAAPVYPQVKWLKEHGIDCDVIIGARSKDLIILEYEMKKIARDVYVSTDDGSYGFNGRVTDCLKDLIDNKGKKYTRAIVIGPMIMMKFMCMLTKELNIPTTVSLNTIMVDGTGMCGACRVTVGDEVKFACCDGPEFDGHLVDFDEAMRRQTMFKTPEGRAILKMEEGDTHSNGSCGCQEDKKKSIRVPVREQDPKERAKNFEEVCLGYNKEEAMREAERCLNCKNPRCVKGCPVKINIPAFISKVKEGDIEGAAKVISISSSLPSVCGRVCPQESQCEGQCVVGIKNDPLAIGKLERFVGDWARENGVSFGVEEEANGIKVAVVGSGPSGLACAGDLAKKGYDVTIFEAFHEAGGVLTYGIPEFRLPKQKVVQSEINNIKKLGVKIETNVVIGRTITVDELIENEGFEAIFIGSGAGLPTFMGIPGENANGVLSANEYLTRVNLMKAYDDSYDTPINIGKKAAIVGGGNVAMDAARTALRLGSESSIVYRRSEKELPARVEEVHHAKEEGIIFHTLTNPKEILVNEDGSIRGMVCVKMELGEPDESGRRRPIEIPGSEFEMEVDTVIMALGTRPNPLISSTTKGLDVNRKECIVVNEDEQTSKEGVYAGGDAVTGAATVISAMGAGKTAAASIDKYLREKHANK